jgi:DNA (cytosine-5)-methyltransferase 1
VPISVVDFFSGCGGTSLGFRDAGMSIIAGVDNDPEASETYRANFPEATFFECDIRTLSVRKIRQILPSRKEGALLFAGCAPCQPFSGQNRSRGGADPRRDLLNEFERFVLAIRPEYVVVENVPGIQKVESKGPLAGFVQNLNKAGYDINCRVLSAADYGVPQKRRRLVLVAVKQGWAPMPEPTHGPGGLPYSTVREWIDGLPEIAAGETWVDDPDHTAMQLSALNLERIRCTPEGGGRLDWPDRLLLDCHQGHKGHTDVYGRLAWDRPAAAMTTRCLSYSNGRYGHPQQDRAISLREAARLQTFPSNFRFMGTLTSKGVQVGNAVPPLLARRIGEAVLEVNESRSGMKSLR